MTDQMPELYWEATYAIAVALIQHFPDHNPEDVGLVELAQIIQSLPGFSDDPGLVTKQILLDIQTVWYEEATSL
ncbi:MAG: Fe-S cluster assembly protein IscX [Ardenticatenaceae bacterium]|nr:Fe-S cluster assembly protein IscX [Ardenticatenaceae bacterium]